MVEIRHRGASDGLTEAPFRTTAVLSKGHCTVCKPTGYRLDPGTAFGRVLPTLSRSWWNAYWSPSLATVIDWTDLSSLVADATILLNGEDPRGAIRVDVVPVWLRRVSGLLGGL